MYKTLLVSKDSVEDERIEVLWSAQYLSSANIYIPLKQHFLKASLLNAKHFVRYFHNVLLNPSDILLSIFPISLL